MDMEMNAEMDRDEGSENGDPSEAASSAGSVFCTLERDYAKLLGEMKGNENLAAYEAEYTRLFEALYKCRKVEEELMEKFHQLEEDAAEKINRVDELERTIECQAETVTKLNEEIIGASKLADAAHAREQNAQEIIENLRLTITKLNHEVEQRNKQLAMDEDGSVNKQRDSSLKERERLINENETLRQRIKSMALYTEQLEKKTNMTEQQMNKIQESLDMQINEISKERVIRDRIEKQTQELEEELKMKNSQLQATSASIKATANNIARLENSLKEQRTNNEKLRKEVSKLMVNRMNLQTEMDNASKEISELEKALEDKGKECKDTMQDNKRLLDEAAKYKAENDWTASKYAKLDISRAKIERDLEDARHALSNFETEMNSCRHELSQEKKSNKWAVREKNALAKALENLKGTLTKMQQHINLSEVNKRKMGCELGEAIQINSTTNKLLRTVEKERDKLLHDTQQLTEQLEYSINQAKDKDREILDGKKELSEQSKKFRQQQNLFESVRAERNLFSKSLTVAKDEIHELQDKLRVMTGQIQHLKEEVANKSSNISKGEFRLGKVEKEKEALKLEMESARKEIFNLRRIVDERKQHEKQHRKDVKSTDMDVSRLRKEIDNVVNERDILGTQLVRRNDQLNLQQSKIKIMHETLRRGESEYNQRLEDIRLLKLEVSQLRAEKILLIKKLQNMGDYRHEIFHLDRDLTRERLKVTALEEELENPLNIHRWRKLTGTDPTTFELLKKIQILQKRVLQMSSELILKTKRIKETEKLYMEIRQILSKQPSPQIISHFVKTREALRERGKQMKCLNAELNMWECRTNEYQGELERMVEQLRAMKMKYYALKRKDQKTRTRESTSALPSLSQNHKKYCGGGFTMLVASSRN